MKRSATHHGFTLIEAIMALVILSISVPTMMYAVRGAHVQRVNPMMASTARWLATEKLEDIIADSHSPTRGYAYVAGVNYPVEANISSFPGYTRSVAVTEVGADLVSAGTGYKKVVVTVSWTDATSISRALAITTVVAGTS